MDLVEFLSCFSFLISPTTKIFVFWTSGADEGTGDECVAWLSAFSCQAE
jgi:hypothetical protein